MNRRAFLALVPALLALPSCSNAPPAAEVAPSSSFEPFSRMPIHYDRELLEHLRRSFSVAQLVRGHLPVVA